MFRTLVLLLAFVTFISSEPVRIVSSKKEPKTYVSPEDAPNQFIMEDTSAVEGLAQVKDEPVTPYYTGPAQHQKKGTPGAAFLSEKDSIESAQMVTNEVLNDPQTLWDLKGSEQKHNEKDVNGMVPADPIPGFDNNNPVIVQGPLSSSPLPAVTPTATSTSTSTSSESTDGVVEADVVALERQATIEEENLREIKAQIVEKKQAHQVEKEMKFKEKLLNVQKMKDEAIEHIKEQAAEQERMVLEQEAEEATKLAQEQSLSPAEKAEKTRQAHPLPLITFLEKSSNVKTNKDNKNKANNKVVRMRKVIQSKKEKKDEKKSESKSDAEEESREALAASHLRSSISSSLADEAAAADARAHHEANIARVELNRANKDEHGWSFLRTATHHIADAAALLKKKEETLSLQDFVNHVQEAPSPTENVATTVTLVDPSTVIDDSAFIQVNRNAKPARALMATIKQMKASM